MNEDYLKKVWDSIWEEGLTNLQLHKKYYDKLNTELKGGDRFYLKSIRRKIDELEMEVPFADLLTKSMHINDKSKIKMDAKNYRTEGDGTEWIVERDEDGNTFKRKLGSKEKIYIKNKSR